MRRTKLLPAAIAGLLGLCCLLPAPAAGAESRDPSIAAGQAALKQGMAAAGKKNWPLAVKHYTEAQRRLHLSPQVMYNLALAHAQAGNELLADVWFRAYLGAVPQAANADQVRAEIARLEQAADEKVQRLFKQAEDLAEALPLEAGELKEEGQRAGSFKSIAWHRFGLGDFKGGEEDVNKAKRFAVAQGYLDLYSRPEYRTSLFAETLAETDINEALRFFDNLKSDYRRKDMASSIINAMIASKDLKELKAFVQSNKVELNYYQLRSIVRILAEAGDWSAAESWASRENGGPAYGELAEAQLKRGNLAEAVRCARLSETWIAMAIRGESDGAFKKMMSTDPKEAFFYDLDIEQNFIFVTQTLVLLNDINRAEKAAALSAQFVASQKAVYPPAMKKIALGYVDLARACLDIANGKDSEAVRQIEAALKIVPDQILWRRDLANFAISRGKPAAAERIADSFAESRERIEFLRRVLALYDSKADRANTERLTKKLAGLLAEVQAGGWDPENPGREFVVNAWTNAAYALDAESALVNLPGRIAEIKKESSPDEMPVQIAICASEIGKGLLRIRALDRIYR
ncbi:MAG TPA: hypothetical protein PKM61_03410 [bacterium]|nr:hypothetical protein [bacterium]